MLKLNSKKKPSHKIEKEVVELWRAIDALPSIHITQSSRGDKKQPFSIWFNCDGKSMDGLFLLVRSVDRRYFKHGWDWNIRLEVSDEVRDDIFPTTFVLQSVSWDGRITTGDEAYNQAKDLVENMNFHLNHENFINGYGVDLTKFQIEEVNEDV